MRRYFKSLGWATKTRLITKRRQMHSSSAAYTATRDLPSLKVVKGDQFFYDKECYYCPVTKISLSKRQFQGVAYTFIYGRKEYDE